MDSSLTSDDVALGEEAATDECPFTEEELSALAMAADPNEPLGVDAVPWAVYAAQIGGPLPEWYMPSATARVGKRWKKVVVLGVIGTFLVIDALGFCSTYGPLVPA